MSWRDKAACLGMDSELFFPIGSTGPAIEQADRAKAVCTSCPVAGECLEYALATGQHDGIWGGATEDERRTLRRARQRRGSHPEPLREGFASPGGAKPSERAGSARTGWYAP